jgi:hypothetical protein
MVCFAGREEPAAPPHFKAHLLVVHVTFQLINLNEMKAVYPLFSHKTFFSVSDTIVAIVSVFAKLSFKYDSTKQKSRGDNVYGYCP